MTTAPIAIDPRGCACTECLTGLYVPLDQATPEQIERAKAGTLIDNTSGQLGAPTCGTQPETATLTYTVAHEAWYAKSISEEPSLNIHKSSSLGGVFWEITVQQVGDIGIQLRIFDDAFAALQEIPEFFAQLATLERGATLADVREILDGLGFKDITQRDTPAEFRRQSPTVRERAEQVVGRLDDETWKELHAAITTSPEG